jgi:hypothetical protein
MTSIMASMKTHVVGRLAGVVAEEGRWHDHAIKACQFRVYGGVLEQALLIWLQ